MWHAMLLLVIHGVAGVLWQTASQLLIPDIVKPEELPSAVRLNASARYLGILVGPAVGGLILLGLGPAHGILSQCRVLRAAVAVAVSSGAWRWADSRWRKTMCLRWCFCASQDSSSCRSAA